MNILRLLNKETVAGVVRHALTAGAGFVAAQSVYIGDDETKTIIAIGMLIFGIAWSVFQKWMKNKKVDKQIKEVQNGG